MATVYLARDVRHDRPVALKVLHPELAVALGPERFLREIKLAARLQHPHIVSVLDSGQTEPANGTPCSGSDAIHRGRIAAATVSSGSGSSRSRTPCESPAR